MRDFQYGWRTLGRSPGTTVMTIALALGIGLTTVMFSILYGSFLRGLPFDDGNRIALVMTAAAVNGRNEGLPMHEFLAYRDAQRSFEAFGAYLPGTVSLSGDENPERVSAARVTAGALSVPRAARPRPHVARRRRGARWRVGDGPLLFALV